MTSLATQARQSAGLTVAHVARKLGYRSERHYRALELHGGMPESTARRWAALTGAKPDLIVHSPAFPSALDEYRAGKAKPKGQLGDWPESGDGADTGNRAVPSGGCLLMKVVSPVEQARLDAGFKTVDEVAVRLNRHPRTIRRVELHGCANFDLAHRLAELYECSANIFLPAVGLTGAN